MQVRPYLMADGGNVELIEIDGLKVRLKLNGACGSCPSSMTTMKMGIERRLVEKIPVRPCSCVHLRTVAYSVWGQGLRIATVAVPRAEQCTPLPPVAS